MIVTIEAVDEILQAEDIEGLLALGAPRDEYAREASVIHSALMKLGEEQCNQRELSALVLGVWDHSFGPFAADQIERRRPVFDRLVQRLLASAAAGKVYVQRQSELEERL